MKEKLKNSSKKLYTMCICLVIVMSVLFLGNSFTKGTYSTGTANLSIPSCSSILKGKCGDSTIYSSSKDGYSCNDGSVYDSGVKVGTCEADNTTYVYYKYTKIPSCSSVTKGKCGDSTIYSTIKGGYSCNDGSIYDSGVKVGTCADDEISTGYTGYYDYYKYTLKTTYIITLLRAEGNETMTTCETGTDGKIASCKKSPGSICGKWTTEPLVNNTQGGTPITSEALMNKVFTSNTTYFCKAGTSIHPDTPDNPDKPDNPSNPSSTPSTPSNPSNIEDNPKTGSVAIFIVWIIALGTLVYAGVYFKQVRENN